MVKTRFMKIVGLNNVITSMAHRRDRMSSSLLKFIKNLTKNE